MPPTRALVLSWLTALALGLVPLPREPATVPVLLAAAVVLVGLTLLLLSAHRRGLLEKLLDVLHGLPLLRRMARALEPRRELLVQMDEQISQFYHRERRRFFAALGVGDLSRCIFMGEYWLIFLSVGVIAGYLTAYPVGGPSSLILNELSVVPFEAGTDEGLPQLLCHVLG